MSLFRRDWIHTSHAIAWWIVGALALLLFTTLGVGSVLYERAYDGRIFPGVTIGAIDVGGLTRDDATSLVQTAVDAHLNNGLHFLLDDITIELNPIVIAPADPDLSYLLVDIPVAPVVDSAFAYGRTNGTKQQWTDRLEAARRGVRLSFSASLDRDALVRALLDNAGNRLQDPVSPQLIRELREGNTFWDVLPGREGRTIDVDVLIAAVRMNAAGLDSAPITLPTRTTPPPFTADEVRAVLPGINAALQRAPLSLVYARRQWGLTTETIAPWITIDNRGALTLDRERIDAYLNATIAPSVEIAARDARLRIDPVSSRVYEFQSARDGIAIERELLATTLQAALFGSHVPLIEIPIAVALPRTALGETNELGIAELLGQGRTSFAGSPSNRRHNISIGTGLLNGVLVPPGKIFSTVGAASPFDETNNYKTELVIKGNRTIPEYGGGLCQVSTTLFRTALDAGLPIVERRNHAYRVSYYEPPVGMDATIYGPKPDFRFRNDTENHLLLVTRVDGSELAYEIWGTNDGRTARTTEPEVFNFVEPPPKKIVETTDIPPGEENCLERAHTGADAKFTYTVTYPDGRVAEEEFKSHYRPWQAVCLIGVEPETTAPEDAMSPPPR
jgi:vancomycin resistance protein YoaR